MEFWKIFLKRLNDVYASAVTSAGAAAGSAAGSGSCCFTSSLTSLLRFSRFQLANLLLCGSGLYGVNLGSFTGDSQEFFQLVVFVSNVEIIIVPAVFFSVENLRGEHVSLALLLLAVSPHVISLVLHAWRRDVNGLELDAQTLEDHGDAVLGVLDLLVPTVVTDVNFDPHF